MPDHPTQTPFKDEESNFRIIDLVYLLKINWYWFLLSILICVGAAGIYIKKTPRIYSRTASVLIKEGAGKSGVSDIAVFQDYGMSRNKSSLENEVFILKSKQLMEEVAARLSLDISYQLKQELRKKELYTQSPVNIRFLDLKTFQTCSLEATPLSDSLIALSDFSIAPDVRITGRMGDTLSTPAGAVIVSPTLFYTLDYIEKTIYITKQSREATVQRYRNKLNVDIVSKTVNIFDLSMQDVSAPRAEDILNTLITVYNESTRNEKNQIAINTSNFINERLMIIEAELSSVESSIASFKSENRTAGASADLNMYLAENRQINKETIELENQLSLTQYIRDYLTDPKNSSELIPANTGITGANIEGQISSYNSLFLERSKLIRNSSDKNPVVMDMNNSLQALKQNIIQTIDNFMASLNMKLSNIREQEMQTIRRISAIPAQQKRMLSVERQQKIKEELYLYLLNKREESILSQTVAEGNVRTVEPASGPATPVAPNKKKIMLFALFLGCALPAGVLWLIRVLNNNVHNKLDVEHVTSVPLLGDIPFQKQKGESNVVVGRDKSDSVSEAFRIVRTYLDFTHTREHRKQVVMFTSFMPSAGKTFVATNLAISCALANKRVILIDMDLRKATLSRHYHPDSKNGVTDYLSGQIDLLSDIILPNEALPNLDVIHAGHTAPNPAELLLSSRLETMIQELKAQYDYIFLDSVPAGMVADATILRRITDLVIYVIRAGRTDTRLLAELERSAAREQAANTYLILNATKARNTNYTYGHGYGYGYGSGKV